MRSFLELRPKTIAPGKRRGKAKSTSAFHYLGDRLTAPKEVLIV